MYLVTGGAGFIGSEVVRALNERGESNIFVVDNMTNGGKCVNLADCTIADYMDKLGFAEALESGAFPADKFKAIIHNGACSNTMELDGRYMMENNFTFSCVLLRFALKHKIPFVYASSAAVYGSNRICLESAENERPLNVYGYSKLAFDQYVRRVAADVESTVVGLRYFNVYGPRESQKGRMASMVYQLHNQLRQTGVAQLFTGTDEYGDGEQRRDFVFVGDVVDVNLFFADGPVCHGVFNLGPGANRSFNDVANALIAEHGAGRIEYKMFPAELAGKYQSFTQADVTALRGAGYDKSFTSLEDGVAQCVVQWDACDN